MIHAFIPERRATRRIHGKYIAKYRHFYHKDNRLDKKEFEAMTLDISEAGVAIVTNRKLKVESQILVKFLINKDLCDFNRLFRKCILFTGKVVYAMKQGDTLYRMGIYFGPPSKKSEVKFFDIVCSPPIYYRQGRYLPFNESNPFANHSS